MEDNNDKAVIVHVIPDARAWNRHAYIPIEEELRTTGYSGSYLILGSTCIESADGREVLVGYGRDTSDKYAEQIVARRIQNQWCLGGKQITYDKDWYSDHFARMVEGTSIRARLWRYSHAQTFKDFSTLWYDAQRAISNGNVNVTKRVSPTRSFRSYSLDIPRTIEHVKANQYQSW